MTLANPTMETIKELINRRAIALPDEFINAYEIQNVGELSWKVRFYQVEKTGNHEQTHLDRGEIKDLMWRLYFKNRDKCSGKGFIIDINPTTVVVSANWRIPDTSDFNGYSIKHTESRIVTLKETKDRNTVSAIIKEGIKNHFKNNSGSYTELGDLWQDYNKFCQNPVSSNENDFSVCRRFDATVRVLRGNKWVVKCAIETTFIDAQSFADYYKSGRVSELAEKIKLKRGDKVNRQNKPINVRILRFIKNSTVPAKTMDLDNPELIFQHALNQQNGKSLSVRTMLCSLFKKPSEEIPLDEIYLILDTRITGDDHSETIIDPPEREPLMRKMRNFIDGAEIFEQELRLSKLPFKTSNLKVNFVFPPAIAVRGNNSSKIVINRPNRSDEQTLNERTRRRSQQIKKYGFLVERPISPLLAFPKEHDSQAVKRMCNSLNYILKSQNISYQFEYFEYTRVDQIRHEIERKDFDAVLVVLPKSQDIHDQIKQRIDVPSQCIERKNILPDKFLKLSHKDLVRALPKVARKIQQRYELSIMNLLVKHHWLPFVPVEKFNYNVQIGLDVGGKHNTDAMSCVGYGFGKPQELLIFRPDIIPIDVQKAEPIPTNFLFEGLLKQFEIIHRELTEAGQKPDFETVVFYRDGQLLGEIDSWNEREAIEKLHKHLLGQGWVSEKSVWTAVEIMKSADSWRIMRGGSDKASNPIAGRVCFPYDEDNIALVCTTGSQYLSQGTACPLLINVIDIFGESNPNNIIQDLVWQSDMCFTKPDMGMRLPWVLYVADAGALQQSKSYKITGVTV